MKVSFTDLNLRDCLVIIKTDALCNLLAPCVLYIGQEFRYSPENAFYILNQQIYFII